MASLQIPAAYIAERIGGGTVLAIGTALCGLCYCLVGIGDGFWPLVAALFLGGLGAATQHPIGSAIVTRAFTGGRALTAFGTSNSAGDIGKVLPPAAATILIMFMPWRPAYGLLGVLGIAAAAAISTSASGTARTERTIQVIATRRQRASPVRFLYPYRAWDRR